MVKEITQEQAQELKRLVEEYVTLIDLIDSSAEVKAKLGPLMDDLGDNDPEAAFGGLDLDRAACKDVLEEIEAE